MLIVDPFALRARQAAILIPCILLPCPLYLVIHVQLSTLAVLLLFPYLLPLLALIKLL
jgi:hypothetical protein